jgi:hypothetical protein
MRENANPGSLTGRPAAAGVLASGGSVSEAAVAAGVHVATVTRWRKDPAFCADVDRLTSAARIDVTARLAEASEALAVEATSSVRVLAELRDSAESPQVRRGAARDILTLCLELRKHLVVYKVPHAEVMEELRRRIASGEVDKADVMAEVDELLTEISRATPDGAPISFGSEAK